MPIRIEMDQLDSRMIIFPMVRHRSGRLELVGRQVLGTLKLQWAFVPDVMGVR